VLEPFGTVIVTEPVGVGTLMRAPSMASYNVTGSRQLEVDVVSLAREETMRLDCDLDQRVASLALTDARAAFAAQP